MILSEIKIGDKAPKFCLPDSKKANNCLKDMRGKWVVLYLAAQSMVVLVWRVGKPKQHSEPPHPVKKGAGKPLYGKLDELFRR